MTAQVLQLAPIVAALRAAAIYREVGDAAGLEAAARDLRNPPSAYVLPGREASQPSGFTSGVRRTVVTAQFLVISVARDIRPGAGGPVLSELETIRSGLIATLSALLSAFLAGVLVGWEDLEDADGAPLPFEPAARDALLDVDYVYLAVAQAYGRAISGIDRKN